MRTRAELLQQLDTAQSWDLVVVGGGITGAGVALAAAREGLSVLLLEQQDYAWGTSSRSSKMVHGGLRYLAQGDLSLTRHSLQEREYLIAALPGLVERMGYYYVLSKKAPPRFAVKILLSFYDWFAGIRNHRYFNREQLHYAVPGLNLEGVQGAYYYTDAVTDDSRLVLRILQEAKDAGAVCINYVKVTEFTPINTESPIAQVCVVDQLGGGVKTIKAHVVVNATGAWADRLRNSVNPEVRVRPQRGSHLVVSNRRIKVSAALTLMHPEDGRYHFIYPWAGKTIIGTTDLDHKADLDEEVCLTAEEQRYLLQAANYAFPQANLTQQDVIATWSGVRPIIGAEKTKDPSKERRDHAIWVDASLVTVSGGKLTTFRLIAQDVLAKVKPLLPVKPKSNKNVEDFISALNVDVPNLLRSGAELAPLYAARYGNGAEKLVAEALNLMRGDELLPISDTNFSFADCRWVLRHEQVEHLDDLLLRRTNLGLILPQGAKHLFEEIKTLCAEELCWNDARWAEELQRYRVLVKEHYSSIGTQAEINQDDKNRDDAVVV